MLRRVRKSVAGGVLPAAANKAGGQGSILHRLLPVAWQDDDSLGPAPGAAGNFTTKDTKNTKATDGSRPLWRRDCAAKSAKEIRMTDMEMVEV